MNGDDLRGRRGFLGGVAALAGLALTGCARSAATTGEITSAALTPSVLPPHPRLIATTDTVAAARTALDGDERGQGWLKDFVGRADRLLREPPATRDFEPKRPVLLPTSRRVLDRIQTLGVAHALTGEDRYAERGVRELLAAADFPDWNPSHFLDAAELGNAAGLGYDWFHGRLDDGERRRIREAIVAKALVPGLREFSERRFWTTATHNWNLVCNGGLTVAALAVADEAPDAANTVLELTLLSARHGFASFSPDGGWIEGPSYWEYATAYAVTMLAALQTAGIDDHGLGATPGFAETGAFAAHTTAPSGRLFNYADGGERMRRAPQHLWLARHYDRPSDAWPEQTRNDAPVALDLLWYSPHPPPPDSLDGLFSGVAVATFRGSWIDRDATWLAVKGGNNAVNHGNLDLGTFVLESGGERFAVDLGGDDYALAGYFGAQRFTYYRTMTVGQNVLVRDGANQSGNARAPIVAFHSEPGFAGAVIDLSQAYPGLRHWRGAALIERQHVVIADEIDTAQPVPLAWQMHTRAEISLDGRSAELTQGRARLHARVLAPEGVVFEVAEAAAPPPQNPNPGVRKLIARIPVRAGRQRLVILLSPDQHPDEAIASAGLRELAEWG